MTKVLALRHMYSGSMFTLERVFTKLGFETQHVEGFSSDLSKIDPLAPDILIVLGGSMGVYEADLYPYLKQEIEIIKARVAADRPMLGICLGSQLTAAAMGCNVYKGSNGRETGFKPVTFNEEGLKTPLKHLDGTLTRVLHWHGDTFDLPKEAILLASTEQYANQAYRIGRNCFTVQFHPEVNRVGLENMLVEDNGKLDVAAWRKDADKYLPTMETQTEKFILDLVDYWGIRPNA